MDYCLFVVPDSQGITFVASKFAVVSFVPSMLFQKNNSVFRGENKQ